MRGTLPYACALATLALVLTGCAASPSTPAPAVSAPATPTSTPEPSAAAPDTVDDVLFTISATARATDGSRVGILLTAHTPLAYSDPQVRTMSEAFLAGCPTDAYGQKLSEETLDQTGSALMRLDLTSNRAGQTFVAPVQLFLGGPYTTQTVTGAGIVPPAEGCTGIYTWTTSESATALVHFQNNESDADTTMWRYAHYGFVVAPDSGATIESCDVTITPLGEKADVTQINGWDPSMAATGSSCGIGYSGE
jgi:hypothetical protein